MLSLSEYLRTLDRQSAVTITGLYAGPQYAEPQ